MRRSLRKLGTQQEMCSIAGLLNCGVVDATPARMALERMMRALHHRGPDDRGLWMAQPATAEQPTIGLVNTRLAILDLSASGHQPMTDDGAGLTLTYNGECYNYKELRSELGEPVAGWRSQTDTEVVLRAYE